MVVDIPKELGGRLCNKPGALPDFTTTDIGVRKRGVVDGLERRKVLDRLNDELRSALTQIACI